jgi:hypothetical protein
MEKHVTEDTEAILFTPSSHPTPKCTVANGENIVLEQRQALSIGGHREAKPFLQLTLATGLTGYRFPHDPHGDDTGTTRGDHHPTGQCATTVAETLKLQRCVPCL